MAIKINAKLLPNKKEATTDFFLSVSKAKTFIDCTKKYKYGYIDKLPRKDWDFHVFGKFCHAVLEFFHQDLLDNPDHKTNWEKYFEESWNKSVEEYPAMTPSQLKQARGIIDEYAEIIKEDGLPNVTSVEEHFVIQLDDVVVLNGYIDRVQLDDDGILHVADYKTTKDPKYLKDFFQLETYAFALMVRDPSLMTVRASYILLKHNFNYMTETFNRKEIMDKIGPKFIKYAENINSERMWRANPQFLCKFCDFLEHCEEGNNYLVKRGVIEAPNAKSLKVGITSW